jgi:CDP-glucose 4,6-dehydratase
MGLNPSFWIDKKVLITGHTGFKGSWLCLWLNKMRVKVSGLSLQEPVSDPNMFSVLSIKELVNDCRGDIVDFDICLETIKYFEPEIVFHMAAQPLVRRSYSSSLETYKTNVIGTANILEAIRNCKSVKSIVAITTDKCYENIEKDYAYIETDPLGGYDPYSSSKACAEHVVSAYYRSFFKDIEVGLATARAGNVIGGGDWASDRLVPDMMRSWLKDNKVIIRYPEATRPWQHVLEPLCGYLKLAEKLWDNPLEFSSAWNFGPDQNSVKTVEDTIQVAAGLWGPMAKYECKRSKSLHEANLLQLDSTKARTTLNWKPIFNFDETIKTTINWYKNYYNGGNDFLDYTINQIIEYEGLMVDE